MKKQNGFSQIVIMVVMLILAIALPVTANLVKKVQDNRSSANAYCYYHTFSTGSNYYSKVNADETKTGYKIETDTSVDYYYLRGTKIYNETNVDPVSYICQGSTGLSDKTGGWVLKNSQSGSSPASTNCSATKCGDCGTVSACNAFSACKWSYSGNYCESNCSSTSCQYCYSGSECDAQSGCRWGYYNSFLSCVKKDSQPTTPTNPHTEKWQTGAVGSGAKCTAAGGVCGDYTSTPVDGESCMVGGRIENGVIASGLCSGDTTVKCCKPSGSAPAPSTPTGCGAVRNQCDGNNLNHCDGTNWSLVTTCKAGCDGSNNTCKDECTIGQVFPCETNMVRKFCNKDADGGIRLKTETCANGCTNGACNPSSENITCEGYIYLKTYPDVAADPYYSKNPRAHYDLKDGGRIWSSATCIGNVAYNCDAGHPSPYNTEVCQYGCDAGHCKGAPAPDCSDAKDHCYGEAYKAGCTGSKFATDNNCETKADHCAGTYYGTYNGCGNPNGCIGTKVCDVCTPKTKRCSDDNSQTCRDDGSGWATTTCGALGCNATTKVCNVCTPGEKQCSGATSRVCKNDGSGWIDTACGAIGCNATTKVCNECTPGNQKCSTSNDYFTCTSNGTWTSTKTNCSGGKICTNLQEGTNVCTEPAYAAPKINLLFAIFGINSNATLPCLGDNKFTITVYKDGVIGGIKTENVVATPVSIGTTVQVFKISDFQLSNNIALTDKIKISISGKKTLAIIYGKNNQEGGFPTTTASQILVSNLAADNNLNLYKFPLLNGDIGSASNIGVKDNVIDGFDFAHMSNQWNKRCTAGQNLESDLNGDCYVDGLDLQIYKKALEKQYSQ